MCLDEADGVWIVLHSGSRGVGNILANIHIDGAKALMKSYFIDLPDPDLAYLVEGTPEFAKYITDMLWAQEYAMGSRHAMLRLVLAEVESFLGREVDTPEVINCHHNFTAREHHMGQNVWLTRKGAIRARVGDRGVIPGSMGAASFIVAGCGNAASFQSCSHGAGRSMSRGKARRELDTQSLIDVMADKAWNNDANVVDRRGSAGVQGHRRRDGRAVRSRHDRASVAPDPQLQGDLTDSDGDVNPSASSAVSAGGGRAS